MFYKNASNNCSFPFTICRTTEDAAQFVLHAHATVSDAELQFVPIIQKNKQKKKLHFRLHHERKTASGRLSRVCSISLLSSLCKDTESLRGVHRERFHRRRTPKFIYSLICSPLCIWQFHLSYRVLASFNILLFTALHVHLTLLYLQTHLLPK